MDKPHVFIVTYGSTGDIVPFIALAKALKEKGNFVTLCCNERFSNLVKQYGVAYCYLNNGFPDLIESAQGRRFLEGLSNVFSTIKQIRTLLKTVDQLQSQLIDDVWQGVCSSTPDIILFGPKAHFCGHFALALGIPCAGVQLFPQHVPSNRYPSLGFPSFKIGAWYNRLTYRVTRGISHLIAKKHIRRWGEKNNQSVGFAGIDLMKTTAGGTGQVINAYSNALVEDPTQYPNVHNVGFWSLARPHNWQPPEDLRRFIESGPSPVYVGFGSMASQHAERVTEAIFQSISSLGLRAVVASGWGGMKTHLQHPDVLIVESVPHDWLFPKVSAVVHHGGAGTTAAGLMAGRPTLVCPVFGDQYFWGKRIHEMRLGPKPIAQKHIDENNFTASIRQLLDNDDYRRNAESMQRTLNLEPAFDDAEKVISLLLKQNIKVE